MKIGDKVRLLRGTEEGYIKAIRGNIIDVEIEDGFVIPSVKNEVVLVNRRESEVFKKETTTETKPEFIRNNLPGGLLLGISQTTDGRHQLVFLNQTRDIVLFCAYQYDKKVFHNVLAGMCMPDDLVASDNALHPSSSGLYKMRVQLIRCQQETKLPPLPSEIELELKIDRFHFDTYLGQIKKDVHLARLEQSTQSLIDSEQLKMSMTEGKSPSIPKEKPLRSAEQIVDLHVDKDAEKLADSQIFGYQLELFEKAYDRALVSNVEKLKIIHGIGGGKLRLEIHKRLSNRKEVRFFEDADKDRFGYGATVIYF
ncbi:MAG: Smr/MutS family protein [Cyclobacteriaceae bacterium]|nr:Smr/MutS family protein [Cyclobacteriaceae bacterium]